MSKKQKAPKGNKMVKEFDFPLSKDEFAEKGQEAAKFAGNVLELELQFHEVKETWKARIRAVEGKRDDLLAVLRAKKEKRTVEVVMEKDFDSKEIRFWFEGGVLEKRTMTEQELQAEMDFQKRKANDDKAVTGEGRGARARAIKQKLQNEATLEKDPVAAAHAADGTNGKANGKFADVADVHHLETKRGTKTSAVDGPTRN